MLDVVDVTKSFGGYIAVSGVSLQVARGEVRAIIGPNGAGKTTFFSLLSGYQKPTKGQVIFDGAVISGKPPHHIARLGVGRAFQTTNIFPNFSVLENVLVSIFTYQKRNFQFWGKRDKKIIEQAEYLLGLVNLEHSLHVPASTLAHGDQRALEIAIALGSSPKLLLLDEPTAGMSPFETQETIRMLEQIVRQQNLTVVLSEHDMEVVFGLAKRITVLEAGRVLAEGTPEEVRNNADVIRAYLGEPQ